MHPAGDPRRVVGQLLHIAEQIDGGPADRRQEDLKIRARNQLRKHAASLLEQCPAQIGFTAGETARDAGQVPDRVDGDLDHGETAILVYDVAVGDEPLGVERSPDLGQVEARAGNRDGRADIDAFGQLAAEILGDQVPPRVERDNARRVSPLGKRADGRGRIGIGQVGAADRIERAGGDSQRAIDSVGAAVAADDVAVLRTRDRTDDRTALARTARTPDDGERRLCA